MKRFCLVIIFVVICAGVNAHADLYPGVGGDVSFTDQNDIYYTAYGTLGYTPSPKTYADVGYTHEWDVPQTANSMEFHIVSADLYHKLYKDWKLGGSASYTFAATPNAYGYYFFLSRLEARYSLVHNVEIGAGPVYYDVYGIGGFIGAFIGLYLYPAYKWSITARGTMDTAISQNVSQQDTAISLGISYNIIRYFGVYALYRLSTGISTSPANNTTANNPIQNRGGIGTMAMGTGMPGSSNRGSGSYPAIGYYTSTISTFTLGLFVTF